MIRALVLLGALCALACSDENSPPADSGALDAPARDAAIERSADLRRVDSLGHDQAPGDAPRADLARDLTVAVDLGPSCAASIGTGTLSGTVDGTQLSATHAAAARLDLGGLEGFGVGFYPSAGTCANLLAQMVQPVVSVILCDKAPGTYLVGANCLKHDGGFGISLKNSVEIQLPGPDEKATSGSVTLTAVDETCGGQVQGSLSVVVDGQQVSGSFDAISCGTVHITP